ncbi:MAG TPA: GldG family protein [Polyangia bacterium]|nr:GldG family protein [Polyangia bacterium]
MANDENNKPETDPKPRSEMNQRKRLSASNATGFVVLVIGAVVAVNLISHRVFGRLDLTENKVYTLSDASKEIVRALPDYLTVKAYISKDLPPELQNTARYVRDMMDDYRTYSKGKLRFEAFDPAADKKIEEEAKSCKVQPLQIQVMRSQKFEVGTYWLGLCFQYQGKDDTLPEIAQVEGLEYQVSSMIKRLTQKKKKIVFTTGHGESDLSQGFSFLKHVIDQEFDAATVNPSTAPIPEDADALVVGGPKQAFDDKGRHEIDGFLMKGRGAIFLVDGMELSAPRGQMQQMPGGPKIGQVNQTGLNELLEKYGFKIGEDFVFDRQNVPGPVDMGGRKMIKNLPVFVGVKTEQTDKSNSILEGVNAVIFPFASSVSLVGPLADGKVQTPNAKLWTLAASSPEAWKQSGFFFFSPTSEIEEAKDPKDHGVFGLAYAYQGVLKSAFPPPGAQPGMSVPDNQPAAESRKPVRLMVVGDSDFASDEYMQLARYFPFYGGGAQMLFNAISWTLEDETLTPVRTKTVAARPIDVSDGKVMTIKVANVVLVPLLFVMFGILRWRVRRASRQGQTL